MHSYSLFKSKIFLLSVTIIDDLLVSRPGKVPWWAASGQLEQPDEPWPLCQSRVCVWHSSTPARNTSTLWNSFKMRSTRNSRRHLFYFRGWVTSPSTSPLPSSPLPSSPLTAGNLETAVPDLNRYFLDSLWDMQWSVCPSSIQNSVKCRVSIIRDGRMRKQPEI